MPAQSAEKKVSIVTEDHVRSIVPPAPTATWYPVSHDTLLTTVDNTLERHGLTSTRREYQVTNDGHRLFATYHLDMQRQGKDFTFMLGLRSATDKAFAASLAFGLHVFVCSNGMFTGDHVLSRKHTTRIMEELPQLADNTIGRFTRTAQEEVAQVEAWKNVSLTENQVKQLLWDIGNANVVPFPLLRDQVWKDYHNPRYPEHGQGTVWTLHNAISEAMKPRAARNPFAASNEQVAITEMLKARWSAN